VVLLHFSWRRGSKDARDRGFKGLFEGYAYMVPYVEDDDVISLKTIFPSRKSTRMYIRKDEK
jgi:hypothetical protein